jgi:uncharacterized Zn finger protein
MGAKQMTDTKPRWTVTLTYHYEDGPRSTTINVEELYELQDIVECGPSFYTVESIEIKPSDRCPKMTVEEAAKQ